MFELLRLFVLRAYRPVHSNFPSVELNPGLTVWIDLPFDVPPRTVIVRPSANLHGCKQVRNFRDRRRR